MGTVVVRWFHSSSTYSATMKNQRAAIVVWKWKGWDQWKSAFADSVQGLSVVERKQIIMNPAYRGGSGELDVGGVGIPMKEGRSLS